MVSLSIIVPSYNGANRLPALLLAVAGQLRREDEVIVVDDCSTDATALVAREAGSKVVSLEKNKGVGNARNVGAANADKEVLVFFDDDVRPVADYLDTVRQIFADGNIDFRQGLCTCAGDNEGIWQRVGSYLWRHYMETKFVGEGQRCSAFYSLAFCVRKGVLEKAGGFRNHYMSAGGEEFEIASRMSRICDIIVEPRLEVDHEWKRLGHRLRTVFVRATKYLDATAEMPPGFPKVGEGVRLIVYSATLFGVPVAALALVAGYGDTIWAVPVFLGLALITDWPLVKDLNRLKKLSTLGAMWMYRALEYSAIAAGMTLGVFRRVK